MQNWQNKKKNTSLHYNSQGNEQSKRWVFRRLQQTGRDGADMTWHSRSFHIRAVAIGKTRSPTVDSRVRQTGSDDVDADLIPRSSGWKSSPTRYVSAVPLQRLKVRTANLYRIHSTISGRASVDDERAWWCDWTWTMKTSAEQQSSSLAGATWVGTTGYWLHCLYSTCLTASLN